MEISTQTLLMEIKKCHPVYEYKAKITNVVDGDTFDFEIDLGFGISYKNRLRLYGVDTPEVRGEERIEGLRVKDHLIKLIEGKDVILKSKKWRGKYGRFIAEVKFRRFTGDVFGTDLGNYLVTEKMARRVDY